MSDETIAAMVEVWIALTYAQADLSEVERRLQEDA